MFRLLAFHFLVATRNAYKIVGEAVRAARTEAGMSQEDLAEKANLARNYIGNVERAEKKITIETLCKLAKALGVRPRDLIEGL